MPRPPVIVVPGPMGMGGQKTQKLTEATLDLSGLVKFIQDYQERKAKEESAVALADMMGIGKVPSQPPATMTTPEATASGEQNPLAGLATGFVNTPPRYGEQDRAALSRTPEGQKTILEIFQKMEPEKLTAVQSELGPVMAGTKGNFGKLFPASKSDSAKEFYAPNDVDTFLMQTNLHGQDYTSPLAAPVQNGDSPPGELSLHLKPYETSLLAINLTE